MTNEQYLRNLEVPKGKIDVVLDTDTYNEIDDQFAVGLMIKSRARFNIKGFCAAPFFNTRSSSPEDGMERSYDELIKLFTLAERKDLIPLIHKGSRDYLKSETEPQDSDAARFMASLAEEYTPEQPLYIVAIGAISNVASAILMNPKMKENCVVVWLGGQGHHMPAGANEFNMMQDIAAARVVFGCGVPLVQLPCHGVVTHFATSKYELEHWLKGKDPLADYLCRNTVEEAESYAKGSAWTRVIWDVTAVAWLLEDSGRFMSSTLVPAPTPEYNKEYSFNKENRLIRYVTHINRDSLFTHLFKTLLGENQ